MPGIFTPLLARFADSSSRPERRRAVGPTPVERRLQARGLAEAIERALGLGLHAHAARIATTAARLTPYTARLGCTLARLRLEEGDAETAIAILDAPWACRVKPATARLLRAAALVHLGGRAQAHADLAAWSRERVVPIEARLMLSLLEWDDGDDHAAALGLLRNLRGLEDPRTLELLLLIAVGQKRLAQARRWVARLHQQAAFGAATPWSTLLCCSLLLPPVRGRVHADPVQIATLAVELMAEPRVIPALVQAQRIRPDRDAARLLAEAVAHALPELPDARTAYESIARLYVVAGERSAAGQWAAQGLARFPMSAPLALLAAPPATDRARDDDRPDVIATIGGHGPQERAA